VPQEARSPPLRRRHLIVRCIPDGFLHSAATRRLL
jgi:hypothetical protein